MNETRYMISDASKQLNVEAHVLRYWEEELGIDIPRTEMGHRYYTKAHLNMFRQIRQLKESGYQLKAIKLILPRLMSLDEDEFQFLTLLSEEMNRRAADNETAAFVSEIENTDRSPEDGSGEVTPDPSEYEEEESSEQTAPVPEASPPAVLDPSIMSPEERMNRFEQIMTEILSSAVRSNADVFSDSVSEKLSGKLLDELSYLLHQKDLEEEERFRKLDESIRSHQLNLMEAAAGRAPSRKRRRRRR